MKNKANLVLFLALGTGAMTTTAVAQNSSLRADPRGNSPTQYATFDPASGNAWLQQVDWDDHHRCDGDHDRDDRNCWYRDRDDRNRYAGNAYYGGRYYQNGWYDGKGNFYPNGANGYYDIHGRWHYYKGHDRDDYRR